VTSVLVLAGGPDAERSVSLDSARCVAEALRDCGEFRVEACTIDVPTPNELRALPGEVIFPALHGPFGEGGPMQDLLEADGRPYVGSGPLAARQAMDKMATKLAAARIGVTTPEAAVLNIADDRPPLPCPFVVKPVHEGSSVGVYLVHTEAQWPIALDAMRADSRKHPDRVFMVERLIAGRELTVGLLDTGAGLEAMPVTEIRPAEGFYDFEAKYDRDDTAYTVDPELPPGVAESARRDALAVARTLGVRDLARADFLLDHAGRAWFLEINTMPGFTGHSLLPMAAATRGFDLPRLCGHLVSLALDRRGVAAR